MPIHTGDCVADRYRVEELVGQGGTARVWRARDGGLDRRVALKEILLPPETAPGEHDREFARLRSEARVLARLDHPAVVSVHDVVQHDGVPVIVMQLSPLRPLRGRLDPGAPWEPRDAARLGLLVLEALRHAHERGVVHRDVKPDNILYTPGPPMQVLVTDFGIARVDGGTTTTALLGTPAYLAPEQWEGHGATPASDLWALGVLLFEAVEGRRPFDGPHPAAVMRAVLNGPVPDAPRAAGLAPVLHGLLVKEPGARMTVAEARRALEDAALGTAPPPAPLPTPPPPAPPAPPGGPDLADPPAERPTVRVEPGTAAETKVLPDRRQPPEAATAAAFWKVGRSIAGPLTAAAGGGLLLLSWRLSWFQATGAGGRVELGVVPHGDRGFSAAALLGALLVLGAASLVSNSLRGDVTHVRRWRPWAGAALAVAGVVVAALGELQAQQAVHVGNDAVRDMPGMWLCMAAAGAVVLASTAVLLARRAALAALRS